MWTGWTHACRLPVLPTPEVRIIRKRNGRLGDGDDSPQVPDFAGTDMPEIDRSGSGRMYPVAHTSCTYAHVHLGARDDGQEIACFDVGQSEFDTLGLAMGDA